MMFIIIYFKFKFIWITKHITINQYIIYHQIFNNLKIILRIFNYSKYFSSFFNIFIHFLNKMNSYLLATQRPSHGVERTIPFHFFRSRSSPSFRNLSHWLKKPSWFDQRSTRRNSQNCLWEKCWDFEIYSESCHQSIWLCEYIKRFWN